MKHNLSQVEILVQKAAAAGAKVVSFPYNSKHSSHVMAGALPPRSIRLHLTLSPGNIVTCPARIHITLRPRTPTPSQNQPSLH
jgi:hypothetical protein